MHRSSLNEGLALYDSSLTEEERITIRTAQTYHLLSWLCNFIVIGYVIYRLATEFDSFFMGYVCFSVFALLASIAYWKRYKTWYGRNILIYFILLLFILISFALFALIVTVEFVPIKELQRFRKGHEHWTHITMRISFFFIPVVHSFFIIYLIYVRKKAEHRVLEERGGRKTAKGKLTLTYKPQVDERDMERNPFRGSKHMV